ncbi:hypothetical protein [Xenorhabdus griffiniae]|uniref:N-acetyltransferase n=1 Tax=Xenorhabdus griffiniae TaxID=351672 RepID=A0ABY9XLV0_9GAMM|nr:hypothetical protein [Xenorhabdus griffiniae]MBD1227398.1 hypothetical protein [Xenorhabdus griffiniae]MBE8588292.1 hypothetical protein [Xenorhabdus griffiniae]WMV73761.1 hypothetical protein QL128_07075 [Xenorhabdus griffiniae]WNH03442.1 hypothetical protein QL112_007080 [Xenorhabdus griffiniae]
MILESKFFSILDPDITGPLTRSESNLINMSSRGSNIKDFITIREVGLQEALCIANQIRTNMINADWLISANQNRQLSREQERWNSRYKASYRILSHISCLLESNFAGVSASIEYYSFVMFFQGTPIGMLIFSNNKERVTEPSSIIEFATHIGIRNSGIFLMEYAVNKSKTLGKNGNIKLIPEPAARNVYFQYGFGYQRGYMVLEPDKSDKWGFWRGEYYFKASCV